MLAEVRVRLPGLALGQTAPRQLSFADVATAVIQSNLQLRAAGDFATVT